MPTLLCWTWPGRRGLPVLRAEPGRWLCWALECRLGVRGSRLRGALLLGTTIWLEDRCSWVRDTVWGSKTRAVSQQGLGNEADGAHADVVRTVGGWRAGGTAVSSSMCGKA